MSFFLLSEVHNKFKPWQQPIGLSEDTILLERIAGSLTNNTDGVTKSVEGTSGTIFSTEFHVSTAPIPPLVTLFDESLPIKTILFWNPFFTDYEYHFGLGREPFLSHNCPVSYCQTTNNRSDLEIADAVVFHSPEISPLPTYRSANQKYVFVQREPHYPKSKQLLNKYYDMFNLTMTYRYDSDIVIPYGKVVNRTNESEPYNEYPPETKTSQIVWVVSHCNSLGRREMYIDELKKHINVDIYGDCGNLTCEKSDTMGCLHKFESHYRSVVYFDI